MNGKVYKYSSTSRSTTKKMTRDDRIQKHVYFTPSEAERIKVVADSYSESFSGFIRRQILIITEEEELLKSVD